MRRRERSGGNENRNSLGVRCEKYGRSDWTIYDFFLFLKSMSEGRAFGLRRKGRLGI